MAEYKLYCMGESGNSYKVALMLALTNADWEPVWVDFFNGETRQNKFRDGVSEMGEVPVLEHAGERISQSGVILDYLAEHTGQFGGRNPGSQPIKLVLGLTGRAGALFGDPGPFFQYQSFAMGGVMFGQQLRGYPEFSITPRGFDPTAESFEGNRTAFGNAYISVSGELGLRFNQMVYLNAFYDAGNNFARPLEFNPTRLFRGAGLGVSVVTPLGPLGLDWAYGFDRTSVNPLTGVVQKDPKWQIHFKLGQLF